jgi:hypothetical protein
MMKIMTTERKSRMIFIAFGSVIVGLAATAAA